MSKSATPLGQPPAFQIQIAGIKYQWLLRSQVGCEPSSTGDHLPTFQEECSSPPDLNLNLPTICTKWFLVLAAQIRGGQQLPILIVPRLVTIPTNHSATSLLSFECQKEDKRAQPKFNKLKISCFFALLKAIMSPLQYETRQVEAQPEPHF